MDLSGWDCPNAFDLFPGFDDEIWCSPFGTDYIAVDNDLFGDPPSDVKPKQEKCVFRPFLSLTTVETVVPELNAAIYKRSLKYIPFYSHEY